MPSHPFRKGMVLAAGLGTRLLPVTEKLPKPLVPVLNVANVLFSLAVLRRAGVREVILNLHHLSEPIERFLADGARWGMVLCFSKERELLGTGGGVKKAEAFFEKKSFILVNCDFISNVDLLPLAQRHTERDAMATMILHSDPKREPSYAQVGADDFGRLCQLPKLKTKAPIRCGIFTGIHFLAPECLQFLRAIPCGINDVLYPHLMREFPERVFADFDGGAYWYDTGEPQTLWASSMALMERLWQGDPWLTTVLHDFGGYTELKPGIWGPAQSTLPSEVVFRPPVLLGQNCQLEAGAAIGPYSVVGDHCTVESHARIERTVLLSGSRIPPMGVSEHCLRYQETMLPTKGTAP